MVQRVHQIVTVDVVAHLFALVTVKRVGFFLQGADHDVRQKPVQFGSGMGRSGQAPAAEAPGFHAEVAPVFLHQQIARHFGNSEQAVRGVVQAHRFVDAVFIIGVIRANFPARCQFLQRQGVGAVAVHLVGGQVDEHRVGAMPPRHLQQDQRAVGVDAEIRDGVTRRPIVGRLGRAMDDELDIRVVFAEQPLHIFFGTDVQRVVPVIGTFFLQLLPVPPGGSFLPEKFGTHVVVDAMHLQLFFGKKPHRFGADQSR